MKIQEKNATAKQSGQRPAKPPADTRHPRFRGSPPGGHASSSQRGQRAGNGRRRVHRAASRAATGGGRGRLHDPHPHPGAGHSARAGGPRPARLRPDRHRQDGGLRPADPPAPDRSHKRARRSAAGRASWSWRPPASWRPDRRELRAPTAATPLPPHAVIFGGVSQGPQVQALHRGVDILVATPGRLLDLHEPGPAEPGRTSRSSSWTRPTACSTWASSTTSAAIIAKLPRARQTLLFSATMPARDRGAGRRASCRIPAEVQVAAESPARRHGQAVGVLRRAQPARRALLAQLLRDSGR